MPNQPRPVLLVRSSGNETDAAALAAAGIPSIADSYIRVATRTDAAGAEAANALLAKLGETDWVIATSSNGLRAWGELVGEAVLSAEFAKAAGRGTRFAAIGETTRSTYAEFGIHEVLTASKAYAEVLATEVIAAAEDASDTQAQSAKPLAAKPLTATIPLGSIALPTLSRTLAEAGWTVNAEALYETTGVSEPPVSLPKLLTGEISLVVLRSPSAANAVAKWASNPREIGVVCSGGTTAAAATAAGLKVLAVCDDPSAQTLARIVSETMEGTN
ncbi:MAG: uroporphyrinogen-III synthase [Micrococcales bacterium]